MKIYFLIKYKQVKPIYMYLTIHSKPSSLSTREKYEIGLSFENQLIKFIELMNGEKNIITRCLKHISENSTTTKNLYPITLRVIIEIQF